MSKTVTIGCRLPSGIVLDLEKNGQVVQSVELAGQRQTQQRSPIILLSADDYGVTEVEESFFEAWKAQVGKDFAPLASGAIFEAKNASDAGAKAKDLKAKKTGHEPASPEEIGQKDEKK